MKLETIEVKPCQCFKTGKPIDCEQCANTVMDKPIENTHNKHSRNHTPLSEIKSGGCNHIPVAIDAVFFNDSHKRKIDKHNKQKKSLKHTIKCDCGNRLRLPKDSKEVDCLKCGQVFAYKHDKKRQKDRWMRVIKCDCGNLFPYGMNAKEVKCFSCNHLYERVGNKWEKQKAKVEKDTLTLGDIPIKVRKRK